MLNLLDIRAALESKVRDVGELPCHVGAFSSWITADEDGLVKYVRQAYEFEGQARRPEHVAALGYGAAAGLLKDQELAVLTDEVAHLAGRDFFSPGRPPRFEVDGIALLGVALGVAEIGANGQWIAALLARAATEVASDPWQLGLVRASSLSVGGSDLRIVPADLAVAIAAKGISTPDQADLEPGWIMTAGLEPHLSGPARDAARLAVFEHFLARQGQIAIGKMTREDLIALLQNTARSMRLWRYETEKRTANSGIARWDVENEYHVQALLWAVLSPVLPDLEDEENLPSIGHKNPRADLAVPTLRTIIEVKFMRKSGQRACAEIIEEVSADAGLYLSKTTAYDNIIAFVWDDCAHTEQHHELKTGLESIKGVSAAIILPRPAKMRRNP